MAKRMGTLDSMHVESIAAKLGHTLAEVHEVEEVALNVARVAGVMGYEGAGYTDVGHRNKRSYWLVTYDIEATMAKAKLAGPLDFAIRVVEPTAAQLVCRCKAHKTSREKGGGI